MTLPLTASPPRSMLRGVLAAAVVVTAGAVLVSTGTVGAAAGAAIVAKLGAAILGRYAAKQLVDSVPVGAVSGSLGRLAVLITPPPLKLAPVPVRASDAIVLQAMGDAPAWGTVG